MKKFTLYFLVVLLVPLLTACPAPVDPVNASVYQPVLMSRTQLETSIVKKDPQPIQQPGKLYRYRNYILINEQYKGIHLVNNQNFRAPVPVGFIQVPGSIDFAVKDDILYADNSVDLVAIDISNLAAIRVTKRIRKAFPSLQAPDNGTVDFDFAGAPKDAVIVGWEKKKSE